MAQITDRYTANVHRRYRAVPHSGGNRFQMQEQLDSLALGHLVPACWRISLRGLPMYSGKCGGTGRRRRSAPSFISRRRDATCIQRKRPITVREAARLQSFPDAFVFPEHQSLVSVARQIGNAVPPRLARALAVSVLEHVRSASAQDEPFATTTRLRERQSSRRISPVGDHGSTYN